MTTRVDKKKYLHEYYLKNKPRWKKYEKAPQSLEQRLLRSIQRREWKESHPEKYLLSCAKYRATKEGIQFDLEISDIVVPKRCPYLGIKLTSEKGKGFLDNLMSLDRIDPKNGYVKGNVEVISYKANRMKNDASEEELLKFARSVIEIYG